MRPALCQRAFEAMTGWWARAARALALVLALSLAAPAVGICADPGGHRGHGGELALASDADADHAAHGAGCHIHCGCHAAARLDDAMAAPPASAARPRYAPVEAAVPSIAPGRLPRPPRA